MALPTEIQTLITLINRKQIIEQRRAALQTDEATLNDDFATLFLSDALGVSEIRPTRLVHVRTQAGKIRVARIFWVGLVNGVNIANAELIDIDEAGA